MDPWKAAQIQRGSSSTLDNCQCIYQTGAKAGRNDYIEAIRFAEDQFVMRTKVHPAPVSIIGESHRMNAQVKLNHRRWIAFGTYVNTLLDPVTLTRGAPDDAFEITLAVPDGTKADELHVYFENADTPTLEWEIRPLASVAIDSSGGAGNWTATITAPAYLFVKPELHTGTECLPHALETYVEDVKVWRRTVNACDSGRFVYTGSAPCDEGEPCSETTTDACFTHSRGWAKASAAVCDEEGLQKSYALERWPDRVEINYITGNPLKNFQLNPQDADILFMLAIANMDCEAAFCPCDTCATTRWEKYRKVPKEPIQETQGSKSYMVMIDKPVMRALRGLPPVTGNLLAIGQIRSLYP